MKSDRSVAERYRAAKARAPKLDMKDEVGPERCGPCQTALYTPPRRVTRARSTDMNLPAAICLRPVGAPTKLQAVLASLRLVCFVAWWPSRPLAT